VNVMRVLRAKSDSLNAMLEAFVHDPLIGWKLLHANGKPGKQQQDNSGGGAQPTQIEVQGGAGGKGGEADNGAGPKKQSSLLHESTIEVNVEAIRVTRRIQLKLQGREFTGYPPEARYETTRHSAQHQQDTAHQGAEQRSGREGLSSSVLAAAASAEVAVEEQVDRLIRQAQAHENLSQMFVGWCGFW